MSEKKRLIALVGNLLTAAFAVVGIVMHLTRVGWSIFAYYTLQSNALLAAASAVSALYDARILAGKCRETPRRVRTFKYISVCMIAVTFTVVIFVLAPIYKTYAAGLLRMLFYRHLVFQHLLSPVFAILTFLFWDEPLEGGISLPALSLIPTLAYAAATVALNAGNFIFGPYPFLFVHRQPVWMSILWFALIVGGAYLIALGLYAAQRAAQKRKNKVRFRLS